MAYIISETGQELLEDVKNFCSRIIIKDAANWDRDGRMPEDVRMQILEMGYQTLTIPEAYGGLGIDGMDVAAILEEIAKADAGTAVMLAGNNLAIRAVLAGGSQEQKEKICQIIGEGGLGAFCLTESQAGSDASRIGTKAIKSDDGGYILNGSKMFITNGSIADIYCVVAVIDGDENPSMFMIEAGIEGLKAGQEEDKLGIRSCDTCQIILENCKVSEDSLIGGEAGIGKGMKMALAALNEGRLLAAAMAVGVAERAVEEAIKYGKERYQFDRPITDNQAIRFKIADMKIKIEAARQLTAYGIVKMTEGTDFAQEAAMAKAFAADVAVQVTSMAMEIFGGYGYSREFPVEKLLRDARIFKIIEGTDEMLKGVIAHRILGKERG